MSTLESPAYERLPATANDTVYSRLSERGACPRVACGSSLYGDGCAQLPQAKSVFRSVRHLGPSYCGVDEVPDERQLRCLDQLQTSCITGGQPPADFARTSFGVECQSGLSISDRRSSNGGRQRRCHAVYEQRLSLFRLLSSTVDEVVEEHEEYAALGMVDYELLPHLNRHDSAFLEKVRRYSNGCRHDIVALDDGASGRCSLRGTHPDV